MVPCSVSSLVSREQAAIKSQIRRLRGKQSIEEALGSDPPGTSGHFGPSVRQVQSLKHIFLVSSCCFTNATPKPRGSVKREEGLWDTYMSSAWNARKNTGPRVKRFDVYRSAPQFISWGLRASSLTSLCLNFLSIKCTHTPSH